MGKKILIVEDESITSFELEMKVQRWGYSVVGISTSGDEAFKMAVELKPDLIIMDIMLNGVEDGVELMERIQDTIEVPFIYVTAHSSDTIMNRAHKTAPYAYIIKPFDDMELKFAIELAFYKYDLEKELKSDERYASLDNLMTGIFIADMECNVLFINNFLADILSNGSSDTLDTNEKTVFQDQLQTNNFLKKLKKEGKIYNQIFTIKRMDKKEIEMNLSAKLENNKIYAVVN